ncbi:MAG: hypothetical protein ACP5M9_00090 [Candidatus Micrarchaeia archaeon]
MELDSMLYAFKGSSKKEASKLIELAVKLSDNNSFVILLEYNEKLIPKIIPAYLNAILRLKENCMRSDFVYKEILILLSDYKDIGNALKDSTVKNPKNLLVVTNSMEKLNNFLKNGTVEDIKKIELQLNYESCDYVSSKGFS